PNWSEADWQEELKSVAMFAAWVAVCTYNPRHHAGMEQFVKGRIKTALLQRYREEWRFAGRCRNSSNLSAARDEEDAQLLLEEISNEINNATFWWRIEVRDVLSRLPAEEHYLLERLFIDGATESEIAAELNISQPKVNRWKQKVLQKLRQMLERELSSQMKETSVPTSVIAPHGRRRRKCLRNFKVCGDE
ncbi:MAG: sigma-70 family RNA polymerase sigma factor, partial [Armatimonadota bacterium]